MSNSGRLRARFFSSSRATLLFVLHPFADEIWAADNTEIAALPAYEIHQRDAVQLF